MIVAKAAWSLAPFSVLTQKYGAIFHVVVGFAVMLHAVWWLVCMGLSRDPNLGLVRLLTDDTGLTLVGKCSSFFLVEGV
jgi:hypothetical protein